MADVKLKTSPARTSSQKAAPRKTTINLAMRETHKSAILTLVIGLIVIAALVFMVAKWGVIDQEARLSQAEHRYEQVHSESEALKAYIRDYPEVQREYRSISKAWMQNQNGKRVVYVDRQAVLDMVDREMRSRGTVEMVQITNDTLTCRMSGMTLHDISQMFEVLEEYPIVRMAALNTAATVEENTGDILSSFSITVYLQEAEEADAS